MVFYAYKWAKQLPKYDADGQKKLIYSVRASRYYWAAERRREKVASNDHNYVVSYGRQDTSNSQPYEVPKQK